MVKNASGISCLLVAVFLGFTGKVETTGMIRANPIITLRAHAQQGVKQSVFFHLFVSTKITRSQDLGI